MNINIYAKYDKIPNITYQDMQRKTNCYEQKVSRITFKGVQRGITIDRYFSVAATAHEYQHLCKI